MILQYSAAVNICSHLLCLAVFSPIHFSPMLHNSIYISTFSSAHSRAQILHIPLLYEENHTLVFRGLGLNTETTLMDYCLAKLVLEDLTLPSYTKETTELLKGRIPVAGPLWEHSWYICFFQKTVKLFCTSAECERHPFLSSIYVSFQQDILSCSFPELMFMSSFQPHDVYCATNHCALCLLYRRQS